MRRSSHQDIRTSRPLRYATVVQALVGYPSANRPIAGRRPINFAIIKLPWRRLRRRTQQRRQRTFLHIEQRNALVTRSDDSAPARAKTDHANTARHRPEPATCSLHAGSTRTPPDARYRSSAAIACANPTRDIHREWRWPAERDAFCVGAHSSSASAAKYIRGCVRMKLTAMVRQVKIHTYHMFLMSRTRRARAYFAVTARPPCPAFPGMRE